MSKHIVDTTEVESGWMVLKGHDPNRRMEKATLVISDERVFTESEVRAIMEHMLDDKWFMHGTAEAREEKIRHIAKTHGIVLDPA